MVLAVDNGEDMGLVSKVAKDRGYQFPVVVDSAGDVLRAYGVLYRPLTVIVGPDGNVRALRIGAHDADGWHQQLARFNLPGGH